jgi:hypothetical protein
MSKDTSKLLRAIASGTEAKSSHQDVILNAAADEIDTLRMALTNAVKIIQEHVQRDALGYDSIGDSEVLGGIYSWPIIDEYIHQMNEALAKGK